jgi:thioredoxin reductase (NADPH)
LSVIIATGASPRKLGVPGEEQYWGSGVTTCAICDAPFYKGKNVVVVGGGDSAVEEAMQLTPYAKNITILVRKDAMRASAHMQKLLTDFPNITVEYNKEIHEIIGDGSKITGVKLFDNGSKIFEKRPIDGVFLAIGHEPNTQLFKDNLEMDSLGYIVVKDRGQETSTPGIFAAGDVEDHTYRQAGVAAGSGIKAALDADAFLNQRGYTAELSKKLDRQLFDVLATTRSEVKLRMVANIEELEQLQASSSLPLIVDISAEWCPSCVQLMPLFESAMKEYGDNLIFVRIDADEASDLLDHYQVEYLPTLLVFKGKNLINRSTGAMTRSGLDSFIHQSLEK